MIIFVVLLFVGALFCWARFCCLKERHQVYVTPNGQKYTRRSGAMVPASERFRVLRQRPFARAARRRRAAAAGGSAAPAA